MQALIFYITVPFVYLLSILPFPVLYLFSDIIYFLVFICFGYRKKIVLGNLRNAFPEKTEQEINIICRKFYHHLCDLFLETFKTLTISKATMLKHCYINKETEALFSRLAEENKSIIFVMGHFGNWEWSANTFSIVCRQQLHALYHPFANKYFDRFMYRMRTRFGTKLIPMRHTFKKMQEYKDGPLNATAFIGDQTPHQPQKAYWTTFLNQDTPVFRGTEAIAKKLDLPVLYASLRKVKRGVYELHAEVLTMHPAELPDDVLTEMHTRRLEEDIISQPENWLWSHRRWKHKRPAVQQR